MPSDRPRERDLIGLTVRRIDEVAALLKMSPQALTRQLVMDGRLYVHLGERLRALESGNERDIRQTRTMTMQLYDRVHDGLDERESIQAA